MALNTRSTRWAVVEESTEGTPVAPSSANEYVALQDGAFSMTPGFESLENAELKGSIGQSKSIQGLENPTAEFSHYLTHSSVEGTPPEYNSMLKSLFGTEHDRGTERDTVAGSSAGTSSARAVLNVDSGEGTEFARGHILLGKDATNGYFIRHVYSVATDALSLSFNLDNAPASGVNLGQGITYIPADSGHTAMSIWDYRANGGAIELISGMQVTEGSIEASANEMINMNFTLEGTQFYYNPIEIASTDAKLDFTDDTGTFAATLTQKVYRSPHDLADEIQTKMNAVAGDTITVSYSDTTGKFTIASDGATTFSLLWNSGANTANTVGDKIGFSVAADDTGAFTYTSDNGITLSSPQTPSLDAADPLVAKNQQVFIGTYDQNFCALDGITSVSATIAVEKPKLGNICAESGRGSSVANARTVTVECQLILDQYESKMWDRMQNNSSISFEYHFGSKDGSGNWIAGKCGSLYIPDCTITALSLSDNEGTVVMDLTLQAHVDSSGNGEVYLGFV